MWYHIITGGIFLLSAILMMAYATIEHKYYEKILKEQNNKPEDIKPAKFSIKIWFMENGTFIAGLGNLVLAFWAFISIHHH